MAAVILTKFLPVLATVAVIFGVVRLSLLFRARAMRAFALRSGLQYIGPTTLSWRYQFRKNKPPARIPFPLAGQ